MSSTSCTFSVGDRRCSIALQNVNGTVPFQSVGVAHHVVDRMMVRNLATWKRCRFLSSTTKDDANSSSSGTALDSTADSLAVRVLILFVGGLDYKTVYCVCGYVF